MNRLFARTLNSSRQLIEEAASGTLVLNECAHELLGESPGVRPHKTDGLWVVALTDAADEQQASDKAAPEETSTTSRDPDSGAPESDPKGGTP